MSNNNAARESPRCGSRSDRTKNFSGRSPGSLSRRPAPPGLLAGEPSERQALD